MFLHWEGKGQSCDKHLETVYNWYHWWIWTPVVCVAEKFTALDGKNRDFEVEQWEHDFDFSDNFEGDAENEKEMEGDVCSGGLAVVVMTRISRNHDLSGFGDGEMRWAVLRDLSEIEIISLWLQLDVDVIDWIREYGVGKE